MEANPRTPQRLFDHPVRYEIPDFQRGYVWTRETQWEPLFGNIEDLASDLVDGKQCEPHFLGAMVVQQRPRPTGDLEWRRVIDGQQRLTTLQLMIDAIEEILTTRGHETDAAQLDTLVRNQEAYCTKKDDEFKVWPSITDRDAFRAAMTNGQSTEGHADSAIVKAHEFFKEKATKWLDDSVDETDEKQRARALREAVSKNLQMVVIDLDPHDKAQIIFEMLNARGTPLLQSDMVKNKLFYDYDEKRGQHSSDVSERENLWPFKDKRWWNKEVGRGVHKRPRVDSFLNDYFTLRNGTLTPASEELRAFENYTKSHPEIPVIEIAKDLADLAELWRDVEEERSSPFVTFARRKNAMLGGTSMPVVLSLLSRSLEPKVRDRALRVVESYLVRRTICSCSNRALNKMFPTLLNPLKEAPDHRVDKVLAKELLSTSEWPDDNTLRKALENDPILRRLASQGTRCVLEAIEEKLRGPYAEGDGVPDSLWVEHIMPQAWERHWPLDDHSEEAKLVRDRAVHTLGNLTLVTAKLNMKVSNAPWAEKRAMFEKYSILKLNRRLIDEYARFDEKAISQRGQDLAELVIQIWPHGDAFVDEGT